MDIAKGHPTNVLNASAREACGTLHSSRGYAANTDAKMLESCRAEGRNQSAGRTESTLEPTTTSN